jgi:LmbE family N-acetylglucosaminyl deacetylase
MALITSDGDVDVPGRLLVVVAHPDDIDFGFSGTVATLTAAGAEVSYCLVTSGDAGGYDDDLPREEMPKMREAEQIEAAKQVGVSDLHFLRFPDGRIEPTLDLRKEISRVIRIVKPDVVATQSPVRTFDSVYRNHPDHLNTGEATMCAVYPDSRNPYAFPELREEGFEAHTVPEMWIFGGGPVRGVDITDVFDKKVAALRAHVSQTGHMDDLEERMRSWGQANAEQVGWPTDRLAELHTVFPTA